MFDLFEVPLSSHDLLTNLGGSDGDFFHGKLTLLRVVRHEPVEGVLKWGMGVLVLVTGW